MFEYSTPLSTVATLVGSLLCAAGVVVGIAGIANLKTFPTGLLWAALAADVCGWLLLAKVPNKVPDAITLRSSQMRFIERWGPWMNLVLGIAVPVAIAIFWSRTFERCRKRM